MTTLALYSIKGGVGKTAAAVNLAYLAARSGIRTLICDLDPQGSSSFYFRVKPKLQGRLKKIIVGKHDLADSIKGTDFEGLDILPADFSYRKLDLVFDSVKKSRERLSTLLDTFKKEYDLVLLDAPPNITLLSENIFEASNLVLVPIIPTTLSERTWLQLKGFFKEKKIPAKKLWGFFSMVDKRKSLHNQTMAAMNTSKSNLLQNTVPFLSEVERMGLTREPVVHTVPGGAAARAYLALWSELRERVG